MSEGTIKVNVGPRVICSPVAAADLEHAAKLLRVAADLCERSGRTFLKGYCVALEQSCYREAESLRKSLFSDLKAFGETTGPFSRPELEAASKRLLSPES